MLVAIFFYLSCSEIGNLFLQHDVFFFKLGIVTQESEIQKRCNEMIFGRVFGYCANYDQLLVVREVKHVSAPNIGLLILSFE